MNKFWKKKALICVTLFSVVAMTTGFSCSLIPQKVDPKVDPRRPVTLNYWRVFDDTDTMQPIISAYKRVRPNVTINYKKLRYEEYEAELVNALAEDRGPDIFSIHNSWVDAYAAKIEPLPRKITMGTLVTKGTLRKTTSVQVNEIDTYKEFSPLGIKQKFVDTVSDDVVRGARGSEQILALPFFVDTLALFKNMTLFRNAQVIEDPKDWDAFQRVVKQLTLIDNQRNDTSDIIQSGAAFGGADNVERSPDIIATLMMQSGAVMTDGNQVAFDRPSRQSQNRSVVPAVEALRFYTDFASYAPRKEPYAWNVDQPNSFQAFLQGKTAMFFGYSYHQTALRAQAPQLNFATRPIPQINPQRPVTFANYWVETVSKKSANTDYAWDFLMFAAANQDLMRDYTKTSGRPTALRSLVAEQTATEDMNAFASQLIMARSWYRGKKPLVAEEALRRMIADALDAKGGTESEERSKLMAIVRKAQQAIQATY